MIANCWRRDLVNISRLTLMWTLFTIFFLIFLIFFSFFFVLSFLFLFTFYFFFPFFPLHGYIHMLCLAWKTTCWIPLKFEKRNGEKGSDHRGRFNSIPVIWVASIRSYRLVSISTIVRGDAKWMVHFGQVLRAEFVICCIRRSSVLPNILELPPNYCSDAFNGKVMHSMEHCWIDQRKANCSSQFAEISCGFSGRMCVGNWWEKN